MRWYLPATSLLALAGCASNAAVEPPQPPTPPTATATAVAEAPPPASDRTLRFSFLLMGNKAGGSVLTLKPDGARDVTWEFNDRGRGPKQTTHYEVAKDGTLSRVD